MKGIVSIKYCKRNEPKENNLKSIKPFSKLVFLLFSIEFIYIYVLYFDNNLKTLRTSLYCYFNFKFQLNESLFQMNPLIHIYFYVYCMLNWMTAIIKMNNCYVFRFYDDLIIIPFLESSLVVLVKEWKKYFSLCCQTLQY